ncbi:MAG: transcriptional coactivator p15/PC4 family protein [Acidobacteriota bacterium]|jgi:hypothetical protein
MAEVVGEMEKGWNEKILFSVSEFKGKNYADIRIYYEDDEGEWKPTKKGVTVNLENFAEFKERVEELGTYLEEKGYI